MMQAALDFWIYLIVMIVWAISSILEARRKAELKRQQEAARSPSAQGEIEAAERSDTNQQTAREALEQAERAAREVPYKSIPVGDDQEVRPEDVWAASEHLPDANDHEATESEHIQTEGVVRARQNHPRLKSVLSQPAQPSPEAELPDLQRALPRKLLGDPAQAIIMHEILQRPRGLQRRAPRAG